MPKLATAGATLNVLVTTLVLIAGFLLTASCLAWCRVPRRRVRAVLPHKRRAIRGARPPIQHNFPTRFRPTARRAD